ncbi:MAG: DUF86 domain-containing protein [Bacteroidales bacterium]|nr:DUF86 domain-containing protein [Bacteroidales bacterium]
MREPSRDKNRLEHILQAISKVEEYTNSKTKEYLANNSLYLHATAYNIQIIGEVQS